MNELSRVQKELSKANDDMLSIEDDYKKISHLDSTLRELRIEAYRHRQLKSAVENMQNILNVDKVAKMALSYIERNELLHAHMILLDLENCRNDILLEIFDPEEGNITEVSVR